MGKMVWWRRNILTSRKTYIRKIFIKSFCNFGFVRFMLFIYLEYIRNFRFVFFSSNCFI